MAKFGNNHFNRFLVKLHKPEYRIVFVNIFELYLDHVEFDLIPNAILNGQSIMNIAKFPKNARSNKLIKKAQQAGLEVYCMYFSEGIYKKWTKKQKAGANISCESWVESVFFELLTVDAPHLYDKENDKILYC